MGAGETKEFRHLCDNWIYVSDLSILTVKKESWRRFGGGWGSGTWSKEGTWAAFCRLIPHYTESRQKFWIPLGYATSWIKFIIGTHKSNSAFQQKEFIESWQQVLWGATTNLAHMDLEMYNFQYFVDAALQLSNSYNNNKNQILTKSTPSPKSNADFVSGDHLHRWLAWRGLKKSNISDPAPPRSTAFGRIWIHYNPRSGSEST